MTLDELIQALTEMRSVYGSQMPVCFFDGVDDKSIDNVEYNADTVPAIVMESND